MTTLVAHNLSVTVADNHADKTLLQPADFELRSGELVTLLGPNGAGKTTLLRAMLGLFANTPARVHGRVELDGHPVSQLSPMARAQQVAYLPQERPLAWPNKVKDVVALGRFAHGVVLGRLSEVDAAAVSQALRACDLLDFAERHTDTLSGGEMARVHCARVYAADTPLLIADEPTTGLDPLHQHRVLELLHQYARAGHGVLVVLHDVNLALRYADRLVWIQQGQLVAQDRPAEVTAERLSQIYGVAASVQEIPSQPGTGQPGTDLPGTGPLRHVIFGPEA